MPEYEDEIAEIVEDLTPLYVAFMGYRNDIINAQNMLTDYTAAELKRFEGVLSENQMEDVVDGLVDYADDFSDFYTDKFSVDTRNLENIVEQQDEDFKNLLLYPFAVYTDGVWDTYEGLLFLVEMDAERLIENKMIGLKQLMIAVSIIGAIVLLLLILLVFKAENSLRRSADSSEKE